MRLVHLPEMTPTRIRIPQLPGMPNGREVANLFDVRIPEIETYNELFVAGRAIELNVVTETALTRAHPAWELMRTMRNGEDVEQSATTANEILKKLQEQPPYPRFRVDHENQELVVEVNEHTFWENIKTWWNDRAPEWIQFEEAP